MSPLTKKCVRCGHEKPYREFAEDTRAKDGHDSRCRACFAQYIKERRQLKLSANPEIQVMTNAVDGGKVIYARGTHAADPFIAQAWEQKAEVVDASNVKHGFLRKVSFWLDGKVGGWNVKPCEPTRGAFVATYVEIPA